MRKLALLTILLFSCHSYADQAELSAVMQHLGDSLLKLIPLVQDQDIDQAALTEEVKRLQGYVHEAEPHFEDQPVTAHVTYDMLKDRIDEAASLAEQKSLLSAKSLLAESMELCASCHAQDRKSKLSFGVSRLRDLDEFQAAEFSFLSRDYESALVSYQAFLKTGKDEYRRSQALDRILAITTEIYGDMDAANKVLNEVNLISDSEKYRVKSWTMLFEKLQGENAIQNPSVHGTPREIEQFLDTDWRELQSFMSWSEQQAYWMLIRRQLTTLLEQNPTADEMPLLLYWMAVADRSTHFQFHESLSRRYLESCMTRYTTHRYAKYCFDEFELLMLVSFSGSGGINMPIEIREEINRLRRLVYTPVSE
jgi:cytochrome c553